MEAMSTPKVRWDRSPLSMFSSTIDDATHMAGESSGSTPASPESPPYLTLGDAGSSSSEDDDDPDLIFHRNTAVRWVWIMQIIMGITSSNNFLVEPFTIDLRL